MSDALVDVFCNNLEVGRSLVLKDVGPTSAYLEHATPMPVGAELAVHTDDGAQLGAVVVRVHEQGADAAREPGMFVRVVQIEGDAEKWWKKQIVRDDDPIFPEPPSATAIAAAVTARTHTVDVPDAEMAEMAAQDRPPEPAPAAEPEPDPLKTTIRDVATTARMSSDQLKAITDQAPTDEAEAAAAEAAAADDKKMANGKPAGKKKKRRRKKKT